MPLTTCKYIHIYPPKAVPASCAKTKLSAVTICYRIKMGPTCPAYQYSARSNVRYMPVKQKQCRHHILC